MLFLFQLLKLKKEALKWKLYKEKGEKSMRVPLGILMIILGSFLFLCVGFVTCFIGGIISIVNGIVGLAQFSMPIAAAVTIMAWGLVKIACLYPVGWIINEVLISPGVALLNN